MTIIIILSVLFYLGVENGASWPWSGKWQEKKGWYSSIPEVLTALILGGLASTAYGLDGLWQAGAFILATLISYAGIQSATWSFLQWGKDNQTHTPGRKFTLMPIVDRIASKWGWSLGDEGYSWVSATVKGTIITLPAGGLGGIFFAFGYEIGSHASKYLKINPSIVSEGMSFLLVGLYYFVFIQSIAYLNL